MPRSSEFSTRSWTGSAASGDHIDSPKLTTLSASANIPRSREAASSRLPGG